ncbi:MAG: DUF167 domain-containing protein [Nitrospinaceae bacterium]
MKLPIALRDDGVQFAITVQPRSSRNQIDGVRDGALRVRLTAPPVDGAANKTCLKFLAKTLGVSAARVTLVRGATSRTKLIHVQGLDEAAVLARLETVMRSRRGK